MMMLAAEAKVGDLFINAEQTLPMCQMFVKLGHPQPPTPLQTDNLTPFGVVKIK